MDAGAGAGARTPAAAAADAAAQTPTHSTPPLIDTPLVAVRIAKRLDVYR